ncbi:MAG: hypothetical protein KHZ65_20105 [Phocaeicola vulgatus]|nr:hypothetical protein [Phocaeicola vulgatus]
MRRKIFHQENRRWALRQSFSIYKGGGSESLPIKDKVCGIKGVAGGTRGRFRYNRVWPWQTGR